MYFCHIRNGTKMLWYLYDIKDYFEGDGNFVLQMNF